MIKLFNKQTNELLGHISPEQLQFLADHLEEESPADTDYFITRETVNQFEKDGADPILVELLRRSMDPNRSIEIRWSKE
jgi:hypothetical protein